MRSGSSGGTLFSGHRESTCGGVGIDTNMLNSEWNFKIAEGVRHGGPIAQALKLGMERLELPLSATKTT